MINALVAPRTIESSTSTIRFPERFHFSGFSFNRTAFSRWDCVGKIKLRPIYRFFTNPKQAEARFLPHNRQQPLNHCPERHRLHLHLPVLLRKRNSHPPTRFKYAQPVYKGIRPCKIHIFKNAQSALLGGQTDRATGNLPILNNNHLSGGNIADKRKPTAIWRTTFRRNGEAKSVSSMQSGRNPFGSRTTISL